MPRHDIDKYAYEADYDELFAGRFDRRLKVMEFGVSIHGWSLKFWADKFPNSQIYGVNTREVNYEGRDHDRITVFHGRQDDEQFLRACVNRSGPLDIIIDDASHIGAQSRVTYEFMFNYLKVGGFYVIEDWGTGYWSWWPDGKRPGNMVDLVKDLFDEVGSKDIVVKRGNRPSRFKEMRLRHAICCIEKAR